MKQRIITISREFGSGGRTIGKQVAQQLGIACYDSELLEKIAAESGFHEGYVADIGEQAPSGLLSAVFSHRASGPNNADYILRDKAELLRVFIHADLAFRANRIVQVYGERAESPEERIRDKDKRRAAYHRFYTNMKWGHAQNYDLTLNSGVLGIDTCVEIIRDLYPRYHQGTGSVE